jgi:hypothetical protein
MGTGHDEDVRTVDKSCLSLTVTLSYLACLAYYVAFGPHGPRAPINPPGTALKITVWVSALLGVAGALYAIARNTGKCRFCEVALLAGRVCDSDMGLLTPLLPAAAPPPRTINKEWEEAANQRAIEQKTDPITGWCLSLALFVLCLTLHFL